MYPPLMRPTRAAQAYLAMPTRALHEEKAANVKKRLAAKRAELERQLGVATESPLIELIGSAIQAMTRIELAFDSFHAALGRAHTRCERNLKQLRDWTEATDPTFIAMARVDPSLMAPEQQATLRASNAILAAPLRAHNTRMIAVEQACAAGLRLAERVTVLALESGPCAYGEEHFSWEAVRTLRNAVIALTPPGAIVGAVNDLDQVLNSRGALVHDANEAIRYFKDCRDLCNGLSTLIELQEIWVTRSLLLG